MIFMFMKQTLLIQKSGALVEKVIKSDHTY